MFVCVCEMRGLFRACEIVKTERISWSLGMEMEMDMISNVSLGQCEMANMFIS